MNDKPRKQPPIVPGRIAQTVFIPEVNQPNKNPTQSVLSPRMDRPPNKQPPSSLPALPQDIKRGSPTTQRKEKKI